MYTTCRVREVSARYPHGSREQARPCDPLLIWLSAVFSTVLFLTVLHLIMTETGIMGRTSNEACGRSNEVDSEVDSEVNSGHILRLILRSILDPS